MPSNLIGYVDMANGRDISGWAADRDNFDKPVTVEILIGGQLVSSTVAEDWREDLQALGFGRGRSGFHCTIPEFCTKNPHVKAVARIQGTDYILTHNGAAEFDLDFTVFIEFVSGDIVNNCNLRCPFCLVDYSEVHQTELMTEKTFLKLVPLMRVVPEGGFWLSCLHEPTLHPQLEHFLSLLPDDCRRKTWFTTNLAKPMREDQFASWANSGLHHINISFDTLNPELFGVIRKFGRYTVFEKNLNTLTSVFRSFPSAPRLRYITMALKCNLDEIPAIIERTHREWLWTENEIRYTYNVEHFSDTFRKTFFLSKEDWVRLTLLLTDVSYRHTVAYPPMEEYLDRILPSANYFELGKHARTVNAQPLRALRRPLKLRYRPNGNLVVDGLEQNFQVNINELEDPCAYFREALSSLV